MLLSSVFVRFYKSFNYNYLRKCDPSPVRQPWESLDNAWYPHVQVTVDRYITTIVGENESGKSCLLSAIVKGISGDGLESRDFCRHSEFFTVEEGQGRHSEFGFEWTDVSDDECSAVIKACQAVDVTPFSRFYLFRPAPSKMIAYFPNEDTLVPVGGELLLSPQSVEIIKFGDPGSGR